ncbi:GNAT family N-acetyltransferase [Arthrobacter sp. HLT1-21]
MNVIIRRAHPDDAGALVALHNRAWREAYGHLGPAEFFDRRDARSARDTAERRGQIEAGAPWTVAVDDDGDLVGLALAGSSRDADLTGCELYFLYVLRRVYGVGVGPALLGEVLGDRAASLWVLAVNHRAVAFYQRHRFVADGAHRKVTTEGSELLEKRMVRH